MRDGANAPVSETCWILTDGAAGAENPCLGLAEALGTRPSNVTLNVSVVPGAVSTSRLTTVHSGAVPVFFHSRFSLLSHRMLRKRVATGAEGSFVSVRCFAEPYPLKSRAAGRWAERLVWERYALPIHGCEPQFIVPQPQLMAVGRSSWR